MKNYVIYSKEYPKQFYTDFLFRYESVLDILGGLSDLTLKELYEVIEPPKITLEDCGIVHDMRYLQELKNRAERDERLKEALSWDLIGTSGTIFASEIALKRGMAYHLGGGFHHAFRDKEGDYDLLNDIAVAVQWVREKHNLKKIMIIDLDVHHANGTQGIFYNDPGVLQISFHGWGIFPGSGDVNEIGEGEGKGYKINLPLLRDTSDETYLYAMDKIIPYFIEEYKPQLIIYQAGVDLLVKDPVGNLKLTLDGAYKRDRKIKEFAAGYPIAVIRGGGYNNEYSPKANINTLAAFADLPLIFSYQKKMSEPKKCMRWAERKITELKSILKEYWNFDIDIHAENTESKNKKILV